MDLSKTVYAIVGVLVAVLIVATVAVPIVETSQSQVETKYNNGGLLNFEMELDDNFTLSKSAGTTDVTLNGELFAYGGVDNYLLVTETFFLMQTETAILVRMVGAHTGANTDDTLEVYFDGSNMVYNISGTEKVVEGVTWGFIAAKDGNYTNVSLGADNTVYVNSPKDVSFADYSSSTGTTIVVNGETTMSSNTITFGTTAVDGYVDLYTLDSITINTRAVEAAIVPVTILAHTTDYGGGVSALLGATLMMLFIVPVMMIVRMIAGRSD